MSKKDDIQIRRGTLDFIECAEILYADDTLLLMKDTRRANHFLRKIAEESDYYNMRLNKNKCKTISTSLRNYN